ncbi:MAG: PASTA domain-containing protein [Nocardioides sp.]
MRRHLSALTAALGIAALAACSSNEVTPRDDASTPTRPVPAVASTPESVVVPDVVGMSSEEAEAALEAAGLEAKATGAGAEVVGQSPVAGRSANEGTSVVLTLGDPEPEGTRADPFPAGTTLSGSSGGVEEVTLVLGPANWAADAEVMARNRFNDAAPAGSTWVLLPVTITNTGSADAIVPWLAFDVAYVAPDGRSFDEASAVIPGELSDLGDLYEGGVGSGNLGFTIPTDAHGGVWAVKYGYGSDPVFVVAS